MCSPISSACSRSPIARSRAGCCACPSNSKAPLETSARVLGSLVELEIHGLPEDALDTYRGRVRAVSGEEVAELSRSLLHPERAAIVVLGPAEVLAAQLEGLGEVEVLEP